MGANDDGNHPCSQAINAAVDNGIVCIVIAGNDGPDNEGLDAPASADKAIVVGAINDRGTIERDDDVIAPFSSRGPRKDDGDDDPYDELKPDVVAPGVNIMSARATTTPGVPATDDYIESDGTSMATPLVSGIVALMIQANPYLTPEDVKQILHQTAETRGEPSYPSLDPKYNTAYGYGIVDAYEAVKMAVEYEPPANISEDDPEPVTLNLPASVTVDSILLSWTESLDDEFDRYELHMTRYHDFIPYSSTLITTIYDSTTKSFMVTDLEANTTYFFKVRQYNVHNKFSDSNEVQVRTLEIKSPDNNPENNNELLISGEKIIVMGIALFIAISTAIILYRKKKKKI
jgi:hypothetical protein